MAMAVRKPAGLGEGRWCPLVVLGTCVQRCASFRPAPGSSAGAPAAAPAGSPLSRVAHDDAYPVARAAGNQAGRGAYWLAWVVTYARACCTTLLYDVLTRNATAQHDLPCTPRFGAIAPAATPICCSLSMCSKSSATASSLQQRAEAAWVG